MPSSVCSWPAARARKDVPIPQRIEPDAIPF
jgi:hypothetical protein